MVLRTVPIMLLQLGFDKIDMPLFISEKSFKQRHGDEIPIFAAVSADIVV